MYTQMFNHNPNKDGLDRQLWRVYYHSPTFLSEAIVGYLLNNPTVSPDEAEVRITNLIRSWLNERKAGGYECTPKE